MGKRKIDARRVKIHRNYTISDAALCLNVHKNTVERWLREGLPHIRTPRPILILGEDLKSFLCKRRQQARKPCPTGHLFCLKCREPRRPAGQMLDYEPITSTSGNLKGICGVCDTFIYRRVALAKIGAIAPDCHVSFAQRQQRLTEPA
jgi:excisionase family DNA binding protein